MAERYTRHMNDRREGRQLYTLPAYARIQPYILRRRSDAACFLSDSVEVTLIAMRSRTRGKRMSVLASFSGALREMSARTSSVASVSLR